MLVNGWILVALASALFVAVLIFFIVWFVMRYDQNRQKLIDRELQLKRDFDHELIKAQLEVIEHTLTSMAKRMVSKLERPIQLGLLHLVNSQSSQTSGESENLATKHIREAQKSLFNLANMMDSNYILASGFNEIVQREIEFAQSSTLNKIDFTCAIENLNRCSEIVKLFLVRCVQEGLWNAITHGEPDKVDIVCKQQEHAVYLKIEDNGYGTRSTMNNTKGHGLKTMEKRIKLLNGSIRFDSGPDKGTIVEITIPLKEHQISLYG